MEDAVSSFKKMMQLLAFQFIVTSGIADDPDLVDTYIQNGGVINYQMSHENYTLLHSASNRDYPKCIQRMVEYGADINAITTKNSTPLCTAIQNKSRKAVEILLSFGASITIPKIDGTADIFADAYEFAKQINDPEIIRLIEEHMAHLPDVKPAGKRK